MKKYFLTPLFLISQLLTPHSQLRAQDKMLTTEDCVFGYYEHLYPVNASQLSFIPGSTDYAYIDEQSGTPTLVDYSAAGKRKEIVTLTKLNDLFKIVSGGDLKNFPTITWISAASFTFEDGTSIYSYDVKSGKLSMKKNGLSDFKYENGDAAPFTGHVAGTIDNNLHVYVKQADGSYKNIAVTSDADINIVNGKSVHREEFGITKGTFWSPNGELLAFYRMDQTMVTDYPIYDLTQHPATVKMIKYPMAGQTSHQVTIGIYNVTTGKTVFLKTGEPKDQYLTNICWSPDENHVYVQVLNRDQNHLWMNCYNAATGEFEKTLFEETSDKYVHPMHPMQFVPGHDDEFIYQSQTISAANPEGLNHLYLYDITGKLLSDMIPTIDMQVFHSRVGTEVTETYGFDTKGTWFYFQGAPIGTCEKQIYAVEVKAGGQIKKLTSTVGVHNAIFSGDKKYFIDLYSSPTVPGTDYLCESSNGKQDRIVYTISDPLAQYKRCAMRLFTIKAADGVTDLWCRMFLPNGFDSTKTYRSLTYVYNGPNVQLVTNSWMGGADLFLYYMAQQGFVVFTVDGRGSGNRGLLFEQATFRHLGTQEIADQQKGNDYLRSLKYIDSKRMAVYGWSFGGFMTTSLMTRTPDLYKCGVAGGPVIDWSYYEVMYTERYMDTPQTNPDGYKESSLLNYAGNLKGKLMQIHGTSDDVVVWQHSLLFQKACVDKNVQCDYYAYPGHLHNVRGKDRVNLLTKIADYVVTNT
ncbi:MAG TPA: DPP IV N-terminal domain-containing protein [Bacteroidia bacterium]|jgi:dipeptidyl-peptidase-4|nr:DPP IV N-terminal domain-containing protein [Bacteroidia bacterium]